MENYKELRVWQRAVDLVIAIYEITRQFPAEERYGLTSQTQRAATSVPANIAEGWGRGSRQQYVYHLTVARGSLMELETHLIVAQRLNYLAEAQLKTVQAEIAAIGKMLNRLISSLQPNP